MSSNGKIHIDLSADDLDGQWIDVANIKVKSPKQFQKIQALADAQDGARAFVAETVVAWYVVDPITGEPIPPPDSPDLDVNAIPMMATLRFTECVREQLEAVLPKAGR